MIFSENLVGMLALGVIASGPPKLMCDLVRVRVRVRARVRARVRVRVRARVGARGS